MSLLTRTLRLRLPTAALSTSIRPLSTTPAHLLKESGDRTPEELEAKKREQLAKQEKGEGHWHSELGSNSEEHVKADREEVRDHDEHVKELQQETKKESEKEKGKR